FAQRSTQYTGINMSDVFEIKDRLAELQKLMADILVVTDIAKLDREIAELETQASEPTLWDNPDHAQQVTSSLSHKQAERKRVLSTQQRLDDLGVLTDLVEESGDAAELGELQSELAALEAELAELETQTLLNGEYDELPAVVTIRAGAGGVDAADFAEKLLRLNLRWREQHDY